MNEPLTTKEQLMQLKAMTVRLGSIHEAQALQLKMWPLLLPNISKSVAKIDVETKTVIMNCVTQKDKKFRKTKKVENLCKHIETWTRAILWNETAVSIVVDGETIYGEKYDESETPAAAEQAG